MGGTLAVVPSIAVAFAVATGRRIGWRRIAVMAVATVGSVVALGMLDHARPASEQTHLGRFVGRLLDGEAGLILRRKMQGNIDLFTASVFPVLGVLVVALGALYAWRRRNDLAVLLRDRRAVRAFLAGFGTVAILGLALNDSGIAVPAVMLAVAVPRVLASMVPVPERVAR
jgi:LPXTG-motif cell wall-anchored protein